MADYLTTTEAKALATRMRMPGCLAYPHGRTPPYKLAANGIDMIVDMDAVRKDGKDAWVFDTLYRAARAATNVATLPVSMAADAVTLGGVLLDRDEPYTESKARRLAKDGKRLLDDVAG